MVHVSGITKARTVLFGPALFPGIRFVFLLQALIRQRSRGMPKPEIYCILSILMLQLGEDAVIRMWVLRRKRLEEMKQAGCKNGWRNEEEGHAVRQCLESIIVHHLLL